MKPEALLRVADANGFIGWSDRRFASGSFGPEGKTQGKSPAPLPAERVVISPSTRLESEPLTRFLKEVLIAPLLVGLVIALVVASTGPNHLRRVLTVSIAGAALALIAVVIIDRNRPRLRAVKDHLANWSPITWRGSPKKRGRATGVAAGRRDEPMMALYVPRNPCERYNDAQGGQTIWGHLAVAAISYNI